MELLSNSDGIYQYLILILFPNIMKDINNESFKLIMNTEMFSNLIVDLIL